MRSRLSNLKSFAALFVSLVVIPIGMATERVSQDRSAAAQQLYALFERTWEAELAADPQSATYLGDTRYNDRWTDLSMAAIEKRTAADRAVLDSLATIPRAALTPAEQLDYDLFEREYRQRLATAPFKPWLYRIDHQGGIQTLSEITELLPFQSVKDYEDWIARLNGIGTLIDQHIALLDLAVREGRTQPRVIMQRIPAQLALQNVSKPEESPFYAPFRRFPDHIDAATRERLNAAALRAIDSVVLPAYRRFTSAFEKRYLPATRDSVGISATPEGGDFYRERIAYHTTSSALTAEEIHAIGLSEVARIRSEMLAIKDRVGFKGSLQEFFVFLRTDPQFYYSTPEALFEAYQACLLYTSDAADE